MNRDDLNISRNDVIKTKSVYESELDKIADEIDKLSDDLNDADSELKSLLNKRKNSSPSDCLVLDGMIDKLQTQRSGIVNRIKRFRQQQAILVDKLQLVEKLENFDSVEQVQDQISKITNGRFSDYTGLAMYLNEIVKADNANLEDISLAVMVSDAEEIQMNSTAASSSYLSDFNSVTKDEDKYLALERELGIIKS